MFSDLLTCYPTFIIVNSRTGALRALVDRASLLKPQFPIREVRICIESCKSGSIIMLYSDNSLSLWYRRSGGRTACCTVCTGNASFIGKLRAITIISLLTMNQGIQKRPSDILCISSDLSPKNTRAELGGPFGN